LIRRNNTIVFLRLANNAFGRNVTTVGSIADSMCSNATLQQLDLSYCRLDDQGISFLSNALAIRNASLLEVDLNFNEITPVSVRALVEDSMGAMKTLTNLYLLGNPIRSEGATILAEALGRNAMPSLKALDLGRCRMVDDGFVHFAVRHLKISVNACSEATR
jgi:Ran GTPase-activating protein (RanGAP) involved in mRNA processing and transport